MIIRVELCVFVCVYFVSGASRVLRNQDIKRYHSLAYAVVQKESDSLFSVLCLLRKVKK